MRAEEIVLPDSPRPDCRDGTAADPAASSSGEIIFENRKEAGRRLAARLLKYRGHDAIVLAVPRGGVAVGFEIARALKVPLDVIIARKLGAPGQPELGIGAVTDGECPEMVLNRDVLEALALPRDHLRVEVETQLMEVERRRQVYRHGRPRVKLSGRTVIVVDDGVATGASILAALRAVKRENPRRVILAVPVGAAEALDQLAAEADEIVCLGRPSAFYGVAQFYKDFHQLDDDEVVRMLDTARHRSIVETHQPSGRHLP